MGLAEDWTQFDCRGLPVLLRRVSLWLCWFNSKSIRQSVQKVNSAAAEDRRAVTPEPIAAMR
jgi:hypothetical protein